MIRGGLRGDAGIYVQNDWSGEGIIRGFDQTVPIIRRILTDTSII